jgi:uncharacterized iron-regulated membrane protein
MQQSADVAVAEPPAPTATPAKRPRRRFSGTRRRARKTLQRLHRWIAMATGLLLLVVVLSGTVLLLAPEIDQVIHPHLYQHTDSAQPVSEQEALAIVNRELPSWRGALVVHNRGIYEVWNEDMTRQAHVDPGTGEVLGTGSWNAGVMGFLANLHECALSCEDEPGYVSFMNADAHILGNDELTVGGLVLAVAGLVLLLMVVSGVVIWWPGIRRVMRGFTVRKGKTGYARQHDLHKVIGAAALPFLAMWAITGLNFELKQASDVWYALMPGSAAAEAPAFASKPPRRGEHDEIDMDDARRIAAAAVPGARIVSLQQPDPRDPRATWDVWLSDGVDSYRQSRWAGDVELGIDRTGTRTALLQGDQSRMTFAQDIWDWWGPGVHMGYPVGWIPRLLWVAFGLAPLALAITGTAMWLVRRRKRRAKKRGGPPPAAAVSAA